MSIIQKPNELSINPVENIINNKGFALQENIGSRIVNQINSLKTNNNSKPKTKKQITEYKIYTFPDDISENSLNFDNNINSHNKEYYESFLNNLYQDNKPKKHSSNMSINTPKMAQKSFDSPSLKSKGKISRKYSNMNNDSISNNVNNTGQEIDFFKEKCHSNYNYNLNKSHNHLFKGSCFNNNVNNINNYNHNSNTNNNDYSNVQKVRTPGNKHKKHFFFKGIVNTPSTEKKKKQLPEIIIHNKNSIIYSGKAKNIVNKNTNPLLCVFGNDENTNSNVTINHKSSKAFNNKNNKDQNDFNSLQNNVELNEKKEKLLHIERCGNFFILNQPPMNYHSQQSVIKPLNNNLDNNDNKSLTLYKKQVQAKLIEDICEHNNELKNIKDDSPKRLNLLNNNYEKDNEKIDKSALGDINNNINIINTSKALMCDETSFSLKPKKKKLFCCILCK